MNYIDNDNFTFEENKITLSINGNQFTGDPAEIEVAMTAARKSIFDFNDILTKGTADKKDIEECIGEVVILIEEAFGNGACNKIFGDKAISLHDCSDVVIYVLSKTNLFEGKKAKVYEGYQKEKNR